MPVEHARREVSLRWRLLVLLFGAGVAIALVQGVLGYRVAREETDAIFDDQMQQLALAADAAFEAGHPAPDFAAREQDEDFDFVLQARDSAGRLLLHSGQGTPLPVVATPGFGWIVHAHTRYRTFVLQRPGRSLLVAQEAAARAELAGEISLGLVWPLLAALPPLLLLVGWWLSRLLRPLVRIEAQLAVRAADDLQPITADALPRELGGLVAGFNGLLARVATAQAAQQRFVADAAHELRSPLAALRLQVQGLQRARDADERAADAQRLLDGIDRATRLVEQLLQLARADGGQDGTGHPLPFAQLLADEVRHGEPLWRARQVRIDIDDATAPTARIPAAFALVLRNLLDNAIRHSPAGGQVRIHAEQRPGGLRLQIEDDGPGVPAAERAGLGERFHRLPGSPTGGSGLGLAIVRQVLERLGGEVQFDAGARGGLRVDVRLPCA
jgi:two-component system OmpR family sensor kinase